MRIKKRDTGCFFSGMILPRMNRSWRAGAKVIESSAEMSMTNVFV